jgi:hypothetical protein
LGGKRDEAEAGKVTGLAKDIAIWIAALEDQTDRMSAWETSFLESISDQFENGNLTENQINKLKEIYDRYY